MKTLNGAGSIVVLGQKSDGIALASECSLALIGISLVLRPLFERFGRCDQVIVSGSVIGAVVLVMALTARLQPKPWHDWVQVVAGYTLTIGTIVLTSVTLHWSMLVVGPVIVTLAVIKIAAFDSAEERRTHRGWRAPARGVNRGLRLVHSVEFPPHAPRDLRPFKRGPDAA